MEISNHAREREHGRGYARNLHFLHLVRQTCERMIDIKNLLLAITSNLWSETETDNYLELMMTHT